MEGNFEKVKKNAGMVNKLVVSKKEDLLKLTGTILGPSEWITIDKQMILDFAELTRDKQWVHTDTEKAKKWLPDGKIIAHGYLTLSLLSNLLYSLVEINNIQSFVNYGMNKLRFIHPVSVDSSVRLRAELKEATTQENSTIQILLSCTLEIEGKDKPAYVAELIALIQ